jgi:hypothetical protein
MRSDVDAAGSLNTLAALRSQFEIRAELLPADLALAGLLDDIVDASQAAIELAVRSTRTAYPLVRTAFEAAQRIVALATDDDYLSTGTRAWLYYQHKDAAVRRKTDADGANRWLDSVTTRMQQIWTPHNLHAADLLEQANAWLKEAGRKRLPDNFMGLDLADVVQERYAKIWSAKMPDEVKQINRGIYSALSRDSHTRLRLEPATLTVHADGIVLVTPRRAEESVRHCTLLSCLELSHHEAIGAVSYLLAHRGSINTEKPQPAQPEAGSGDLPRGHRPDLGMHLVASVQTDTVLRFAAVLARRLDILPDGAISWSANVTLADREYIATFDAPSALRMQVAEAMGVRAEALSPSTRHDVRDRFVDVECNLGAVQQSEKETFVPFLVSKVERQLRLKASELQQSRG